MRLLIAILCILSVPAFAQDGALLQQKLRLVQQSLVVRLIVGQISRHQPILLPQEFSRERPSLGTEVTITATDIKGDDGDILQLVGIEISTGGLVMQADELHFHWATDEIELKGNVHLKRIAQ